MDLSSAKWIAFGGSYPGQLFGLRECMEIVIKALFYAQIVSF